MSDLVLLRIFIIIIFLDHWAGEIRSLMLKCAFTCLESNGEQKLGIHVIYAGCERERDVRELFSFLCV